MAHISVMISEVSKWSWHSG